MGNDEPEGDMPILLQTLLSRDPRIFGDKSMLTQYKVWGGKKGHLDTAGLPELLISLRSGKEQY